jgi:hypothetical protein
MNALQILSIFILVIGLAGAGAGYFWKSRGDTVIQLQGKEIEYWKGQASIEKSEREKTDVENATLKEQNKKLAELAQGSPQLINLTKAIRSLVTQNKNLVTQVTRIAENGTAQNN